MKDIIIDFVTQKIINGKIEAVQGDNTSRKVKILLKENSNPYNLTGKTVLLTMKKNSSNSYVNKGDFINLTITNAVGGEVELPINKNFTKEKGGYQLQISVMNEADFEENTMLFEAVIHTNLREDISGTLVESIIFKELKEVLEKAKDVVANEEQRKLNEQQRIQNEITREEFFNTQMKPTIKKVDTFTKQVTKNTKDIERAFEVINENTFVPYQGKTITIEHSKVGFTKDMKIEGETLQNLFPKVILSNWSFQGGGDIEGNALILPFGIDVNDTAIRCVKGKALIKPNTTYTVIVNVISNTTNHNLGMSGYLSFLTPEKNSFDNRLGISKMKCTSKNVGEEYNCDAFFCIWGNGGDKSTNIKFEAMLLEGDYTNKEIPDYFEGIKSVGETEGKIIYKSNGKNLFNSFTLSDRLENGWYKFEADGNTRSDAYFQIFKNQKLTPPAVFYGVNVNDKSFTTINQEKYWCVIGLHGDKKDDKKIIEITLQPNTKYTFSCVYQRTINLIKYKDIQIEENEQKTIYEPYKKDLKEIIIPYESGLKGLGNTKDIIDIKENSVHVIQKIEKKTLTHEDDWQIDIGTQPNTVVFYLRNLENSVFGGGEELNILSNFAKTGDVYNGKDEECIRLGQDSDGVYIRVLKTKLETVNVVSWKRYLQSIGGISIYYKIKNFKDYKLENINSLNLETFKDITYVGSENLLKPNLNFKAPVNTPALIGELTEKNAMLLIKNEELQEKNVRLEEVNQKQTIKILELDDITNFLIEDTLSRKLK